MRPREYYDQFSIQEDSRYVFTLIPPDFEDQYKKYIREPIEKIKLFDGKVTCTSNIEFKPGIDQLDEIWKRIQIASVIIANIKGFDTNVMFALGVALMKKGRVSLIAEKSLDGMPNLPFNLSRLGVLFYEPGKLDEFSDLLVNQVEKWIIPDEPKYKDHNLIKLMKDVLELRRKKLYDSALLLFESMDIFEPGNWYIYKEWGITYKESKKFDDACKKLQKALEFTKSNRQKSQIYTELGVVYQENNMVDDALVCFEKAENYDRDNAKLYEEWAYLYYNMGKFHDAMNKMMIAVKLDENKKVYKRKFEFYMKKVTDNNFNMSLKNWLSLKKKENRRLKKADRIAASQTSYELRPFVVGKEIEISRKVIKEDLPDEDFKKEENIWENIVEMCAQVIDIDDKQGVVYLNCKYKKNSDETFERIFPLKHFKNKDKLKVDQSILVKVLEKPGEVRFLFEEADEDFFDQDVVVNSINDLKDSPIFKPL